MFYQYGGCHVTGSYSPIYTYFYAAVISLRHFLWYQQKGFHLVIYMKTFPCYNETERRLFYDRGFCQLTKRGANPAVCISHIQSIR
ncbi:hypothetical protein KL86CLO1_11087 [uncultured Eubacteriales bacterium]|uniref:Uncharacterized protein n=1 Tax=uncultured Eubacteriales bacterium TaxID=172733 RepID=A0A212JH78_9FIRM|nr:hypothetical protein KL86CLO1_11087 [uncultured Eubacteriales bacterium]